MVTASISHLVILCLFGLLLIYADDIKMQDTPAFQAALPDHPCATSCAIIPSETFKTERCAETDFPNAASCICGNPNLSSQLAGNISSYCSDHCGATFVAFATAILSDYCRINIPTTTGPPSSTTPSTASPGSNPATTTPVSTSPPSPSPAPKGGLSQESKISLGVGIGIGLPGAILACIGIWLAVNTYIRRRNPAGDKGTEVSQEENN